MIILFLLLLIFFTCCYYFFFSPSSQFFGKVILKAETLEKVVALSFDDGPNEPYTGAIADILDKFRVRATFFQVGENAERFPETVKRLVNSGHVIGNHSYGHSIIEPIRHPDFEEEIQKTQEIIFKITGKTPILFRPPWFFRQPKMLKTAEKHHLVTVTGTFSSYCEVFQMPGERIAGSALKKIRPGAIIVFHDGYDNKGADRSETVKAVEIVISSILKDGYRVATIPELLGISAYQ